jgi:hypothetical protein
MKLVGDSEIILLRCRVKNREEMPCVIEQFATGECFWSDYGKAGKLPDIFNWRGMCGDPNAGAAWGSQTFNDENYKLRWLQGSRKLLREKNFWLRGPATIRIV